MKKSRPAQKNSKSHVSKHDALPSPVQAVDSKHQITPLKTRSKTSKCEEGEDVHTVNATTPVSSRSKNKSQTSPVGSTLANMYYLGCCSQEVPEVIWDYNSTQNSKGAGQRIRTMTIDDLLKNMHYNSQGSNNESQSSGYLHLLEKWMQYQNKKSPVLPKGAGRCHMKALKKSAPELLKEIQAIFKSFTEAGNSSNSSVNDECRVSCVEQQHEIEQEADTVFHRELKRMETTSSVGAESSGCDSNDEFWGEANENDDSLIVKATHELETCLISNKFNLSRSLFQSSSILRPVIPETCVSQITVENDVSEAELDPEPPGEYISCMRTCAVEPCSELCSDEGSYDVSKLVEDDWDFDLEDDIDLKDDVLVLDTLSQVPDDALEPDWQGNDLSKQNVSRSLCDITTATLSNNKSEYHSVSPEVSKNDCAFDNGKCHNVQNPGSVTFKESKILHCDLSECANESENQNVIDSTELFFEMDSEVFNDESLFNETDENIWLDVKEDTSPKCTPKEIAQKKAEAVKRLKEKQMGRKKV